MKKGSRKDSPQETEKRWHDSVRALKDAGRNRKRRRLRRWLIAGFAVLMIAVLVFSVIRFRNGSLFSKKKNTETVPATVVYVYDGDTILVRMKDGTEETVRLLMVDAPESVHPDESKNTEEGRRASAFLTELLKNHSVVYLEYEDENNNRDMYGRLLAYVWLCDTTSVEPSFIKDNMVNAILLLNGHAVYHLYQNGNPVKDAYRRVLEGIQ